MPIDLNELLSSWCSQNILSFLCAPGSNLPYLSLKAARNPVSRVPDGFYKGLFWLHKFNLSSYDCLVISGSAHISLKYGIPVKALVIQPMFPIVPCYRQADSYWNYVNNYLYGHENKNTH